MDIDGMILDRLLDPMVYLMLVGLAELVLLGVFALCALPFAIRRGWRWYWQGVGRAIALAALLLGFGVLANSIWMLVAYHRWYVSADTVVDFWPFIPFGQWVLDHEFGNVRGRLLGGATLRQLQLLWLVLASGVWLGTILSYRRMFRRAA